MKKSVFLFLMIVLGLAACQNDKAPTSKTTADSAVTTSVTTDVANGSVKEMQQAGKQKQTVHFTDSAIAVTKPAKSNTARSLQAALHQMTTTLKTTPKAALSLSPIIPAVPAVMPGDAAKGKSVARKCKVCHNFTAKKKVGPGLKGVFGRKAGLAPGMKYSAALAAGDWVWNEKNLALWVCDSKKAVKTLSGNASAKTKMGSQRICNAEKQANLIAFLKTL